MGWASIPRSLGNINDADLHQKIADILEDIINTGIFPEVFNCTRLIVLNKVPSQIP
jgi:hypothetical protein